jgi:adenylate cyclase
MAAGAPSGSARSHRLRRGGLVYRTLLLLLALASITGLGLLRVTDPFLVRAARETAFDLLQRASPRAHVEAPVRIVDIDERALDELGQWPWPRDRLAELVERLHAAGAAVVVFDFIFAESDRLSPRRLAEDLRLRAQLGLAPEAAANLPDTDAIFAGILRQGQVVLGFGTSARPGAPPPAKAGFAYTGADPVPYVTRLGGGTRLLPELAEAADGVGSVNLGEDLSLGVVRRTPLLWTDGARLYPSLIAEALRVAQGAQTYVVHADPQTGGVVSVRIGGFEVPTEPTGELYLHFTPPRPERYVSAAEVFDNQRLGELVPVLQGHIALVGTSAPGLFDFRTTPLGDSVPGVEIHAQAIEQIINRQYLMRHDWTRGLELLALAVAALVVTSTTLWSGARLALLFGAVVAAMIVLGSWDAFRRWGVLIDPSFALGGGMAMWFVATAFRYLTADREKREIRGAFAHYVHPSVLREIERNRRKVRLGGENCELTVLFTDVRDFTRLSERLEPEQVVAFLNTLHGRLASEITREGGVIDKFIGDSVMAFWNAPLRQEDHARRACAAALRMRHAVREMNARAAFGLPAEVARDRPVEIGVGINTGWACVGNVGSAERLNYSAIGDAVNVAARAEAACKELGYDLVACRSTAGLAPDFAFLEAGAVRLKGRSGPVPLMLLIGDAALKTAPEFVEFSTRYRKLLDALRDGRGGAAEPAMADCRGLAGAIDARLMSYLDRLPERAADFRPQPQPRIGLVSG